MKLRYPVFVFTWWVTGTMAIACYTAAFVWTMEMCSGKWKIYLGMSMNYSWPVCRLIIAGLAYSLRDWHWHLRCKISFISLPPNCPLTHPRHLRPGGGWLRPPGLVAGVPQMVDSQGQDGGGQDDPGRRQQEERETCGARADESDPAETGHQSGRLPGHHQASYNDEKKRADSSTHATC